MKDTASLCGVLATLAALFKHSKREEIVSFAPQVLAQLTGCNIIYSNNTLIRKFAVKLAQVSQVLCGQTPCIIQLSHAALRNHLPPSTSAVVEVPAGPALSGGGSCWSHHADFSRYGRAGEEHCRGRGKEHLRRKGCAVRSPHVLLISLCGCRVGMFQRRLRTFWSCC